MSAPGQLQTIGNIIAHMLAPDTERLGTLKVSLANGRSPPAV
jgi:hypothetical protein